MKKVNGRDRGSREGTMKNSLALTHLSSEQLHVFAEKVERDLEQVTHGVSDPIYHCLRSPHIPFNAAKLSLAPVTFHKWMMELGGVYDFVDYSKPWAFAPATCVMAFNGMFCQDEKRPSISFVR